MNMKSRITHLCIITGWLCSALPTLIQAQDTVKDCENLIDNRDKKKDPCSEDTPESNPFWAYNGDVTRNVTDLKLTDGVGDNSLEFQRMASSRWPDNYTANLGSGGNWRHNFFWDIRLFGSNAHGKVFHVSTPSGGSVYFHKSSPGDIYYGAGAGADQQIIQSSSDTNQFYLLRSDGERVAFYLGATDICYVQGYYDAFERFYPFTYDDAGRLSQVTDPITNHFLRLNYGYPTNATPQGLIALQWQDASATSVMIAATWNGADYRTFGAATGTPSMIANTALVGRTQNVAGEQFVMSTNGGCLYTTWDHGHPGFGSFGQVYVNYDSTNLYIGGLDCYVQQTNHSMVLFLGVDTLTDNATRLPMFGPPDGLQYMRNLAFGRPMDIAILLGDEWGDLTDDLFQIGSGEAFGQGAFYLGNGEFDYFPVPGTVLCQFDGNGTNETQSTDDDGNRLTDRWMIKIPWSSLNASGIGSINQLEISGVFAAGTGGGYEPYPRFISGNYLGDSAAGTIELDNNFGYNSVVLTGTRIRLPGQPPSWDVSEDDLLVLSSALEMTSGTPVITDDPAGAPQNNIGDAFDFVTNGGSLGTSGTGSWGDLGSVYMNCDSSNLYIGGIGLNVGGSNNAAILFLDVNTLSENATNLSSKSGQPNGLDFLHNVTLERPMDIAILLGDEWGDLTLADFGIGSGYAFGQGLYYLGSSGAFETVPGSRISQFDGTGTNATTSDDGDGNRITERWEVSIPWSSLNAANASSITRCAVAGLIASDSVNGTNRYLSGKFLGDSASGAKDANTNFAFNTVSLKGSYMRGPGYTSNTRLFSAGGGLWTGSVNLTQGTYEYKYLVNGTNWVTDTNNPHANSANEGASQIIIPPELLTSVSASDGRSVEYEYDFIVVDGIGHAALSKAIYGDGASAKYYYKQPAGGNRLRPVLGGADDPMMPPPYSRVAYSYQREAPFPSAIFGVSGMIYEERNLISSQLIARMTFAPNGDRIVEYGDGTTETYTYSHEHPMGIAAVTNSAGESRGFSYTADGMQKDFMDEAGRTFTRGLTPYFGVITSSVSSAGGSHYWKYTDDNYPMYLAQETDELGRSITYTRDGSNRIVRVDYPDGTHQDFTHTAFGQIMTERKRDGGVWSNNWTEMGRLATVTDPLGHQLQFNYDTRGRIVTQTDPLGHTTEFSNDWRGNLVRVVEPDGATIAMQYDSYGNITDLVSSAGGSYVFNYDGWGFPSSQADPLGNTTYFSFNDKGQLLSMRTPVGLTISNSYDGLGRRVREDRYPGGYSRQWTYGPDGLTTQINELAKSSSIEYDALGYLRAESTPRGNRTAYGNNLVGQPLFATNAMGDVTTFAYDAMGRIRTITDCTGAMISNTYDGVGRLIGRRDALGNLTEATYNSAGNLLCIKRNGTALMTNVLNEAGWAIATRAVSGTWVSNTYDAVGRVIRRTMPDSSFEEYVFTNGLLCRYVDRARRTNMYERDLLGRITNEVNQAGHSIRYEYNQIGQLTRITDQEGRATQYVYNEQGKRTAVIYPDDRQDTYEYDAAGQQTLETDPLGRETHRLYDDDGNLTYVDFETDPDISVSYDLLGRISGFVDGVGTTTYSFISGCIKMGSEDGPFSGDVVSYGYDPNKRLTNVSVAGQNVVYGYDSLGRMNTVRGPEGVTTWTFDGARTAPAIIQRANGVVTRYAYDGLSRLTNLLHETSGGSLLASFGYTYNQSDERVRITRETGQIIDAAYDDAGQLTSAHGSQPGYDFDYVYDAAGNHLRQEQNGLVLSNEFNNLDQLVHSTWAGTLTVMGKGSTTDATVTVNGQTATIRTDGTFVATNISLAGGSNVITSLITDRFGRVGTNAVHVRAENRNYSYDPMGNLTNDGERVYRYNQANQLVAVNDAQGGTPLMTCRYDALGRRRERVQWENGVGVTNRYIYNGWLVQAVLDGNDQVIETYTHGPDLFKSLGSAGGIGGLLAGRLATATGTNHWFLHDGTGNAVLAADDTESAVGRYDYGPFGQSLIAVGAIGARFRFSGKEWDANMGSYYFGYRFYMPAKGCWLNRDPMGQRGGINLYDYVGNSPLRKIDPWGLWGSCTHDDLTRRSMELEGFSESDMDIAAEANLEVDAIVNQLEGGLHYMPDSAERAQQFIDCFLRNAARAERRGDHTQAMKYLGTAMHIVQDKAPHYDRNGGWIAHSNKINPYPTCYDPDDPAYIPTDDSFRDSRALLKKFKALSWKPPCPNSKDKNDEDEDCNPSPPTSPSAWTPGSSSPMNR